MGGLLLLLGLPGHLSNLLRPSRLKGLPTNHIKMDAHGKASGSQTATAMHQCSRADYFSVLGGFEYFDSQFWFWRPTQSLLQLALSNSIASHSAWQHEGLQMLNTLHHVTQVNPNSRGWTVFSDFTFGRFYPPELAPGPPSPAEHAVHRSRGRAARCAGLHREGLGAACRAPHQGSQEILASRGPQSGN